MLSLGPWKQKRSRWAAWKSFIFLRKSGAGEGIRTLDPNLGSFRASTVRFVIFSMRFQRLGRFLLPFDHHTPVGSGMEAVEIGSRRRIGACRRYGPKQKWLYFSLLGTPGGERILWRRALGHIPRLGSKVLNSSSGIPSCAASASGSARPASRASLCSTAPRRAGIGAPCSAATE